MGPRLKTLDFTKQPFPLPALLGLRKLHAFLKGTRPLTPSEAADYDDFDINALCSLQKMLVC